MFKVSSNTKKHHSRLFKLIVTECMLCYLLLILSYGLAGILIYRSVFPFGLFIAHLDYYVMSALMVAVLAYLKFFRIVDLTYKEIVKKIIVASFLVNTLLLLLLYFAEGVVLSIYYFVVAYTLQVMLLVMLKLMIDFLIIKFSLEDMNLVVVQDIHNSELTKALKNHCKGKLTLVDPDDSDLRKYVDQANKIYLTGSVNKNLKKQLIAYCDMENKRVFLVPEIFEIIVRNSRTSHIGDTPVFEVGSFQLMETQYLVKRIEDIVLSVLGILLTMPIMLFAAIGIKMEDGGPVFFRQERSGLRGQSFNVIKFRSMVVDAEKYSGAVFAVENDPRVTKMGRFMRSTRIDEIPQFFNVLTGSMSVVGPRPERPMFVDTFSKECPEYCHRLAVKPGITGLAQVMGNYTTTAENKIKFDLMYIINYSVMLDIQILFQTLIVIFKKEQSEGFSRQDGVGAFNLEQFSNGGFVNVRNTRKSFLLIREIMIFTLCILVTLGATFYRFDEIAANLILISSQMADENITIVTDEPTPEGSPFLKIQEVTNLQRIVDTTGDDKTLRYRIQVIYNRFMMLELDDLLLIEKIVASGTIEEAARSELIKERFNLYPRDDIEKKSNTLNWPLR